MSSNKTQKNKAYRVRYSLGDGQRGEICLGKCYDKETVTDFRNIVKSLAASIRCGTRLSMTVSRKVETLPVALRKILINHRLIEGTADETIPVLAVLIEHYAKSRAGLVPDNRDKRCFTYLMEYFGNVRIDLITPSSAAGIRDYLMNCRTTGRGCLKATSVNRIITDFKSVFNFAVNCDWLSKSPFSKVKGGKDSNLDRKTYISPAQLQTAINVCGHIELEALLVFARYAGLRIPCEVRDLRFCDFTVNPDGSGIFKVPDNGKTGSRTVPLFEELVPYIELLRTAASSDTDYLFPYYRTKHPGTVTRKRMLKAGVPVWEQFYVNLRSCCITDKKREGWPDDHLDAAFGNSKGVRQENYIQPLPDAEYAKLGRTTSSTAGSTPPETPPLFTGTITEFGLLKLAVRFIKTMRDVFDFRYSAIQEAAVRSSVNAVKQALSSYFETGSIDEQEVKRLTAQAVNSLDETSCLESELWAARDSNL